LYFNSLHIRHGEGHVAISSMGVTANFLTLSREKMRHAGCPCEGNVAKRQGVCRLRRAKKPPMSLFLFFYITIYIIYNIDNILHYYKEAHLCRTDMPTNTTDNVQ